MSEQLSFKGYVSFRSFRPPSTHQDPLIQIRLRSAHPWIRVKNSEPFWQKVFFFFSFRKTTTKTGGRSCPCVQRGSTHGEVNYSPCCRRLRWRLLGHRQTSLWEALPLTEHSACCLRLTQTEKMKNSRRVKTGALLEKGSLRRTRDATHRDVILKDKNK